MIKFKKDFNNYFKTIGIKPGDTIYLGLNLGKTFLPYRKNLFKKKNLLSIKNKCCELILNSLKELVGKEGTIIVPTFSFSFIKQKKFDIKNTSSTLGFFENFFLKQKKIKRSPHPLYSISVWGKNKKIIKPCGRFSFGINSPFTNFLNYNVKFVNIGCRWVETGTYVHHLEHLNGINHRFYKPTTGKVILNGYSKIDTYYNPVRFFNLKSHKAEYKIEKFLIKNNKIKEINKKFYCSAIKANDIYDIGLKILKNKPSFFMSKETIAYIDKNDKLSFIS